MFGVAVKITDVPGQKGLGFATIEIPAGSPVFPTIVMVFEVAGLPVGQATEEFITQFTKSPEAGL